MFCVAKNIHFYISCEEVFPKNWFNKKKTVIIFKTVHQNKMLTLDIASNEPDLKEQTSILLDMMQNKGDLHYMIVKHVLSPCDTLLHESVKEDYEDEDDDEDEDEDDNDNDNDIHAQKVFILRNVFVTRLVLMIAIVGMKNNMFSLCQRQSLVDYLSSSKWWSPVRNSSLAIQVLTG